MQWATGLQTMELYIRRRKKYVGRLGGHPANHGPIYSFRHRRLREEDGDGGSGGTGCSPTSGYRGAAGGVGWGERDNEGGDGGSGGGRSVD